MLQAPGGQIIDYGNACTGINQLFDQMGANKTGPTGHENWATIVGQCALHTWDLTTRQSYHFIGEKQGAKPHRWECCAFGTWRRPLGARW